MLYLRNFISNWSFKMSKKINFPAADRNKTPILEVLQKHFNSTKEGQVLEVSSGTGQHISYFAPHFPKLIFQPSENDPSLFESIRTYASEVPTKNVKDPIKINAADNWNVTNNFDYIININMIHITPFSCTLGLFKNAGEILKPDGLLITYGAYANNGVLEPQSNRDFDRNIRATDPSCGVRDIQDLIKVAQPYGIRLEHIYELPANNKCLVWRKLNT